MDTTYTHQELLNRHNLAATDLPEKTQKKIAKFTDEPDEDKKDALDETIFGEIEDHLEADAANKKAAAKKQTHATAKKELADKKKINVNDAPTAAGKKKDEPPAPKKERSFLDEFFDNK